MAVFAPPMTTREKIRHRVLPPHGPLSGPRRRWRRVFGTILAGWNEWWRPTPGGRLLHARIKDALEISPIDVPIARLGAGLDGLSIAFLSDLHAGFYLHREDFVDLARAINVVEPDLVLLGGDLVNTRWDQVTELDGFLRTVAAPLGVFAVPGNHEYYRGRDLGAWRAHLEEHGVTVLVNDGRRVRRAGASLWLAGIDDLTEGDPDPDAALAGRDDGEPALLLSHHPDVFELAPELDVDLQLSGHTHGGQIRVFGMAPLHHSRFGYDQGLFRRGASRLYVGRGVGVTALPLRIDARPEVPLLRLRCA
jgi:predicted MPP superfamily phosphohydrolase